jgi:uncharacterized RDD family membrane protein YckC
MTDATLPFLGRLEGLPDPEHDRQFYAGVPGRRIAAWVVDAIAVGTMSLIAVALLAIFTLGFGLVAAPLVVVGIAFLYRVSTVTRRSATWGMRLMGIELRRADGTRFDAFYAAAHTAMHFVSLTLPVLAAASLGTLLLTRYRQTLPDIILRSAAINRPED